MVMKKQDIKKKKHIARGKQALEWPLDRSNYLLFGFGLLVLVLGYFFLAQGPWDSFWSRTLAPIVLVIGYCVLIPVALLYEKKGNRKKK